MGPDLALDLKLSSSFSSSDDGRRPSGLESYIHDLEDEKRKIEAFRRDLPLSTLLVSHVIQVLRGELQQGEVIALGNEHPEKMTWLASAHLWTLIDSHKSSQAGGGVGADRKVSGGKTDSDQPQPRGDETLLPFTILLKEEGSPTAAPVSPDLSLVSPVIRIPDNLNSNSNLPACGIDQKNDTPSPLPIFHDQNQPPRKQRRCWSPELHRHFVFALQKLGGAHVATPKQIREQMKMEGLTNDEVKSHLQKYRLHTRRMPNSSFAKTPPNTQMIVVGGMWGKEDRFSPSVSPQCPLQLARSSLAVSVTAGDSYEEDGRSESYSWK